MKKNKMMRLASFLLVATLLTTSMISGTFAKYVTSADGGDQARVAKFGVEVAVEGADMFAEEYDGTVESIVPDDLVAPGTKNDDGIFFTLKGKPEVDVNVDFAVTEVKEVFLKAGTYADMTTANDKEDTFTFDEDYYPVVFTLSNGNGDVLESGKLSEIETYLEGLGGDYDANTDLSADIKAGIDGTYKLTWAWDFPTVENADTDKKDTLLGDMAADTSLRAKYVGNRFYPMAEGQEYCNNVSFKVAITVTQID